MEVSWFYLAHGSYVMGYATEKWNQLHAYSQSRSPPTLINQSSRLTSSTGFPLTFGLFQSHYSTHPIFGSSAHVSWIPTIGALATGLAYLLCPIISSIALRYPAQQIRILLSGYITCLISLILASLSTQIWHLLLTQGVLYGTGWVICYTPFLIILNEWFEKRRGLAYGILFGASGVSGLMLPFILEKMLALYGFRITLRIYVIATLVISAPTIVFIKHRIHPNQRVASKHIRDKSDSVRHTDPIRNPLFYFFAVATFLQGIAFFIPNIFLPTYSIQLSKSPVIGDIILSVTACAQVVGQISLGHFSDRVTIHLPSHLSAIISGLAVLFIWGPTTSSLFFPTPFMLCLFSAVWGAFAGSYSVLWTRISSVLANGDEDDTMRLYGWLSAIRGIASVLTGPVSALLVGGEVQFAEWGLGRFKALIVFTGICLCASATAGLLGWIWNRTPKRIPASQKSYDDSSS